MPETHAFDELTKGLASNTLSRRRALKLGAASALGAALVPFGSAGAAAKGRRRNPCRNKPDACRSMSAEARCGPECACIRRIDDDKKICVRVDVPCPKTDQCDRSRDCPGNQQCIIVRACCGSRRNLCVRKCS